MKKLYRSREDKKLAGVLGGLAEMLGVDSTILRVGFVGVTIFTACIPLLLTYLIAWMIVPLAPARSEEEAQSEEEAGDEKGD